MTTQQQIHEMVDNLNPNGLNYIIGVLNSLDADKWVNVPFKSIPKTNGSPLKIRINPIPSPSI